MSDVISRADAMGAVHKYYQKRFTEDSKWDADAKMLVLEDKTIAKDNMEICNIINALPSADVIKFDFNKYQPRVRNKVNDGTLLVEAVQGEWIRKEREYNDCDGHYAYYWYECSVCGARPPKDQWKNEWHSNYCPSCGARMTPYKGGDTE